MNGLTYEALALNRTPVATFGYIVQVAISLAVVLGLIYLTSRYLLPRLQVNPKGKLLEVLDRVGLEPQVTAYVIKFNKTIYVVGVSNKGISLLDKQKEGESS